MTGSFYVLNTRAGTTFATCEVHTYICVEAVPVRPEEFWTEAEYEAWREQEASESRRIVPEIRNVTKKIVRTIPIIDSIILAWWSRALRRE